MKSITGETGGEGTYMRTLYIPFIFFFCKPKNAQKKIKFTHLKKF